MSTPSINLSHLGALHTAQDVHELFRLLGYPVESPDPFAGDDLNALDLDPADHANVTRAYIVTRLNTHTVYLYEVDDLRAVRLRSLAWNILERGTGLLVVTTPAERGAYREIVFIDPRFAGKPIKSSVRVNKLKVITSEPTRHDLDTLNAIHAHRRTAQQVYDAQGTAFNVTTVTKRFYDDYRGHYERTKAAIKASNLGVHDFYDADKLHAFTQRLLGRLMFLYFLQRKGWLGERPRFLTERYAAIHRRHAGEATSVVHDVETYAYYQEILEPLFFQTMNTKRPGDITKWEGIRIPYLNGGLFDEARDPSGPILVPDSVFDPNDVHGLLGFFNRYNFTIANDTPLEQDVAVDPEMLGKVFENLLEERDRGQSGSFYTPRAIVAYMCQEALAGYLEESASLVRETTRALFDPDANGSLTTEEAVTVNAALDTLTVLDPAVGSGSFLIGMLNEIMRLRHAAYAALHPDAPEPDAQTLSNWKAAIIRDTLYGVDIKPEAIEIAQLRLWLALIVDQTLDAARPLPNLDYKLMAGNSLIETIDGEPVLTESATAMLGTAVVPVQPGLGLFQAEKERGKLDEMRRAYFSATPEERKRLKPDILNQERRIVETALREKADVEQNRIDQLGKTAALANGTLKPADARKLKAATDKLARLTNLQAAMGKPGYISPFFLYRLHFSEVFEKKGGFDIVVANPPYVRGDDLGDKKIELEFAYPDVFSGRADLYVYFYVRGFRLLKPKGQLAFISSNKFIRAKYGKGLRGFLVEKLHLRELIDFGELPVFKEAATFPMIVMGAKDTQGTTRFTQVTAWSDGSSVTELIEARGQVLPANAIQDADWQLANSQTAALITKLKRVGVPLGDYVNGKIYRGIVTGLNEAFVIDAAKRTELIAANPKSAEIIKPFISGDDVRKWYIKPAETYVIFIPHGFDISPYTAILQHLAQYRERLEKRATSASHEWYELQQPQMGIYPIYERPKLIYPEIAKSSRFMFDPTGLYINKTIFCVDSDDLFLLGILNSSIVWHFLKSVCSVLGDAEKGGRLMQSTIYMETIPIPTPPTALRDQIAAAAQACLDAAKDHPEQLPALETELNALVYQAYGLDDEDIAVIEGVVGGNINAHKDEDVEKEN